MKEDLKTGIKNRDEILNGLREQYPIEEETKFNEFNISDKLKENVELKLKYQHLHEKEEYILSKLQERYNEMLGEKYDHYRFNYDRVLSKSEIENYYLPKNEQLKKTRKILTNQEIKVKFFKLCYQSIDNLYWRMKEFLKNEG